MARSSKYSLVPAFRCVRCVFFLTGWLGVLTFAPLKAFQIFHVPWTPFSQYEVDSVILTSLVLLLFSESFNHRTGTAARLTGLVSGAIVLIELLVLACG
ncbi:MAG: hypothetical protein HYU64_02685 [Armatimonadetes bacterium]|nr:hypothetical protein [Armatimonadota bacterium]